tara:strand:- start:7048 stop:7467 length:420 start_codon:yes stop_codon:yes gene_type:complete
MEKKITKFGKDYWSETGAYSKEAKALIDDLVPNMGRAKTNHGELLRCITNLIYEHGNNGNGNTFGQWDKLESHWEKQLEYLIQNMDDTISAKGLKAFVSSLNRDEHLKKYNHRYSMVMDSIMHQIITTEDRQVTLFDSE